MMSFISNSDYIIASGIQFPVKEVLGIIAYPAQTSDTMIYLSSVEFLRKLEINHSIIKFTFSDSTGNPVIACTITGFDSYRVTSGKSEDVIFLLTDPITGAVCGHMITTPSFCVWLRTSVRSVATVDQGALQINPTYIYSQNLTFNSTVKVNGTEVVGIIFNNMLIDDDGSCHILGKEKPEIPSSSPIRMTALRIQDQNGNSTLLKGESVGFSITPAPPKSMDDKVFCRSHITTTTNEIIFTDQGTGL